MTVALELCRLRLLPHRTVRPIQLFVPTRVPTTEHSAERSAELFAHDAVQYKVDGTIDEHEYVEDVSQRHVYLVEDVAVYSPEERQYALGELGDDEAHHDRDQHHRRTVVFAGPLRVVPTTSVRLELAALLGRDPHRSDQQRAEHGEQDAWRHLEDDAEQPMVEVEEETSDEGLMNEPVSAGRPSLRCVQDVVRDATDDRR